MIIATAILDQDGLVQQARPVLDRRDPIGWRVRHHFEHDPIELHSIRPGTITSGHGGQLLGLVQHAEIGERQTWIVGDIVSLDATSNEHGELYASIEGVAPDGRLELHAVALVAGTATIGVRPVRILSAASGVSDSGEVDVLRLRRRDPFGAELLARAQAQVRGRRHGEPVHVHRQHRPTLERTAGGGVLVDGDLIIPPRRSSGALWPR